MQTGAFEITDGRINVTTTNGAYDIIKLRYNGSTYNMETLMSSTEFSSRNLTTNRDTTIAGGFFFQRDLGTGQTITNISDGVIDLYSSGSTLRQRMNNDGKLWQYDANGKKRTYLEYGDIFLYTASETQTLKLSGAAFPALGGSVQLYDTSANERTRLTAEGLIFYNSSGTKTASYPAVFPTWTYALAVSANQARLSNCSGTISKFSNIIKIDTANRIVAFSGRAYITSFSRTGANPGLTLDLTAYIGSSTGTSTTWYGGTVCNQNGVVMQETVYAVIINGVLHFRSTESAGNISGNALSLNIGQTFIKY